MVGRGEEAIRAVNGDRTFWGQGVRDGGSRPDGMTGKLLPGRMPCCSKKHRIDQLANQAQAVWEGVNKGMDAMRQISWGH